MKKAGLMLLALMLVVAACGDDDGGGTDSAALENEIVAGLTSDTDPGNPFGTEESARCVASGVIEGIGADRVQALADAAEDFTQLDEFGADMTEAEMRTFASVSLGCADLDEFAAANFADQGLPPDVATCAAEVLFGDPELVEALFADAIIAELSGEAYDPTADPAMFQKLMEALNPCLGG